MIVLSHAYLQREGNLQGGVVDQYLILCLSNIPINI